MCWAAHWLVFSRGTEGGEEAGALPGLKLSRLGWAQRQRVVPAQGYEEESLRGMVRPASGCSSAPVQPLLFTLFSRLFI